MEHNCSCIISEWHTSRAVRVVGYGMAVPTWKLFLIFVMSNGQSSRLRRTNSFRIGMLLLLISFMLALAYLRHRCRLHFHFHQHRARNFPLEIASAGKSFKYQHIDGPRYNTTVFHHHLRNFANEFLPLQRHNTKWRTKWRSNGRKRVHCKLAPRSPSPFRAARLLYVQYDETFTRQFADTLRNE